MILIDTRDRRPIYEQITEKLAGLMLRGVLKKDEPMPSVRSLAADLSITPNTVQRAYAELERRGYIYSIGGKGSFVADPAPLIEAEKERILTDLDELTRRALRVGIPEDELCGRIHSSYGKPAPEEGPMSGSD